MKNRPKISFYLIINIYKLPCPKAYGPLALLELLQASKGRRAQWKEGVICLSKIVIPFGRMPQGKGWKKTAASAWLNASIGRRVIQMTMAQRE
jgi:hypothetical protein